MTFDPSGLTAYVNGEFVDATQASVSIFDHGFLYGDGVFEGMRVFDGGLFRAELHLKRLERSSRTIGLPMQDGLLEIIGEVVRRSGLSDAHVRPIIARGFGGPGIDPRLCPEPTVIVSAYPFPPFLGSDPIRLMTSPIVRKAPRSLGAHVKSLNYLDAIVAKQQAVELGAHDAVMLDRLGAVAECTGANLFVIDGETLVTPTTRAALPGITRRTVLEMAAELGIETAERDIWPAELHCADGAFVCGSGAGIVPIGSFDGRPVAQPEHPLILSSRRPTARGPARSSTGPSCSRADSGAPRRLAAPLPLEPRGPELPVPLPRPRPPKVVHPQERVSRGRGEQQRRRALVALDQEDDGEDDARDVAPDEPSAHEPSDDAHTEFIGAGRVLMQPRESFDARRCPRRRHEVSLARAEQERSIRRGGRVHAVAAARAEQERSTPREEAPRRGHRPPHPAAVDVDLRLCRGLEQLDRVAGRSSTSTWSPPRPWTISLRSVAPAARSASTSAARSATSSWIRFQPPGSGLRPSGIAWAAPPGPAGSESSSRSGPRERIAKGGAGRAVTSNPSRSR